ncbi:MAG: glycosyltransferase family 4 protein [Methanothrix sp.]|nr:glycosyltransferase family 4 protein [Methanothrix sp.]
MKELKLRLRIFIIGNQATSLLNFRGPLISYLAIRGHEVSALAPDYDESTRSAVRALGARPVDYSLSRTGMNPLRDMADTLRLISLLRQEKPDAILTFVLKPAIYGTIAAWIAQVPLRFATIEGLGYAFVPADGPDGLKRKMLRAVITMLSTAALHRAEGVFFLNKDDLTEFTSRHILPSHRAILLGGIGVDLRQWAAAPPVIRPVTFLMAARLLREKGIGEYAAAARLLRKKHPDARFILLGSQDDNPGALSRCEIEEWTSDGTLEWPGYVPDVRTWLLQASVFVFPSYYREGVPRITQEAMAMARPVITTDAPGCCETVVDGKNGFLVPVRDVGALADAMERFIDHPELIERMGQASRAMAEERFDVQKVVSRIYRILKDADNKRKTIH